MKGKYFEQFLYKLFFFSSLCKTADLLKVHKKKMRMRMSSLEFPVRASLKQL